VDFVLMDSLKPRLKPIISREAVYALRFIQEDDPVLFPCLWSPISLSQRLKHYIFIPCCFDFICFGL